MPSKEADKVIGLFSINFQRNEMRHFSKRVNHDPNGVATIWNKEVGYKIHRDGLPGRVIQFQGLKKAGRRVAWSFITLVFVIIPDIITNRAGDTGPPKIPGNKF